MERGDPTKYRYKSTSHLEWIFIPKLFEFVYDPSIFIRECRNNAN